MDASCNEPNQNFASRRRQVRVHPFRSFDSRLTELMTNALRIWKLLNIFFTKRSWTCFNKTNQIVFSSVCNRSVVRNRALAAIPDVFVRWRHLLELAKEIRAFLPSRIDLLDTKRACRMTKHIIWIVTKRLLNKFPSMTSTSLVTSDDRWCYETRFLSFRSIEFLFVVGIAPNGSSPLIEHWSHWLGLSVVIL